MSRLLENYKSNIVDDLKTRLNVNNIHEVPKLTKIVINMGIGDAKDNKNSLSQAIEEMTIITGQRPVVTKARKAISNFKLRIGDPVGVKVTLRGTKMYEFLDRFISISSPRIRDFRGFSSKGFDGSGNYNFGIKEHYVFPEIVYEDLDRHWGLDIALATSATNNEHGFALLKALGFPFKGHVVNREEGK